VIVDLTEEKLSAHLFDSLRNKIMPLSHVLVVYPNHGEGSTCHKMMNKKTTDTLGHQKEANYPLRVDMTKEEFIVDCEEGYRSKIAASHLKQRGFDNVVDVEGGFEEILEEDEIPTTNYVCPTTLL